MAYQIDHRTRDRASPQGLPGRPAETAVLTAEALFRGAQVLVIEFGGERYQLRKTRNGKLILTK